MKSISGLKNCGKSFKDPKLIRPHVHVHRINISEWAQLNLWQNLVWCLYDVGLEGMGRLLSSVPLLNSRISTTYYEKSPSFSNVFKNFFIWWLENPCPPLRVFTGSLLLLLSQESSHCLSNFSMEFISVGYLDMANTFCVSLCPLKLNRTCTPCLLSLNGLCVSLVSSAASSALISLGIQLSCKGMARITQDGFFQGCALTHCPHLANSSKHRLLICLSCFQELILGVDASQRKAAPPSRLWIFLPGQGLGYFSECLHFMTF